MPQSVRLRDLVSGRNLENPKSPSFTSKSTYLRSIFDKKSFISASEKEIMSAVVIKIPSTVVGDLKSSNILATFISRCRIPAVCRSSNPLIVLLNINRASSSERWPPLALIS